MKALGACTGLGVSRGKSMTATTQTHRSVLYSLSMKAGWVVPASSKGVLGLVSTARLALLR